MQAQLNLNEFSYLLHTLGAKQVVGIDNESVFPADETTRDTLLTEGFENLQENGWLIPHDSAFQTNAELVLLVAIIAAPENTIMLTRRVADEKRQTITYYQAQGIFVEQLYTAEKQYLLTRLDSLNEVMNRLTTAMAIPQHRMRETAVSLKVNSFEKAMAQAKSGQLATLTTLLTASELAESEAEQTALHISQLHAAGNIELASFSEEKPHHMNNLILLKNETDIWTISPTDQPETLRLQTIDFSSLSRMIQTFLNN